MENPTRSARLKRRVRWASAWCFSTFSLFDTLTVAENVLLGLDERYALADVAQRIRAVSGDYGLKSTQTAPCMP